MSSDLMTLFVNIFPKVIHVLFFRLLHDLNFSDDEIHGFTA